MSWLKDLYDTYEVNVDLVGKYDAKGENPLLPVFHILTKTCISVIISEEGKFIDSQVEPLRDTITPCSEKSIARSGRQPPAHGLTETLDYLDRNFTQYVDLKECVNNPSCSQEPNHKRCKTCESNTNLKGRSIQYLKQLQSWKESGYAHRSVISLTKYLNSQSLIADLISNQTLFCDKLGKILLRHSSKNNPPAIFTQLKNLKITKANKIGIRWIVQEVNNLSKTWLDSSLHKSWIDYSLSISTKRGLCQLLGKSNIQLSSQSPKFVRDSSDGSILISANDHANFTYKGKFEEKITDQVATIGLEANHKAHAALKWLLKKQGYNSYETFALVAWSIDHSSLPQPMDEDDLFDDTEGQIIEGTKEGVGRKIASQIRGYSSQLIEDEDIVILGIDAPSKGQGRSSIVHYSKYQRSEYLGKLESWHTKAAWRNYSSRSKSFFWGAPSPKHIAEACYKRKVNGKWETDAKVLSRTIKELLPCILHSSPIPKHLVKILIERSSQRGSYKKSEDPKNNDQWHWERILEVTCSVYKHHINKEYTMALDTKETSRDYLYGRLLAIADRLEEVALYKQATHLIEDKEEKKKAGRKTRLTNAARLMYAFSKKPYTTWQHIHDKLLPYIQRLSKHGLDNFYLTQIQNVNELFEDINSYKDDSPLNGEYLLAFYSQRKDLQPPKNTNKTTKNEPNK